MYTYINDIKEKFHLSRGITVLPFTSDLEKEYITELGDFFKDHNLVAVQMSLNGCLNATDAMFRHGNPKEEDQKIKETWKQFVFDPIINQIERYKELNAEKKLNQMPVLITFQDSQLLEMNNIITTHKFKIFMTKHLLKIVVKENVTPYIVINSSLYEFMEGSNCYDVKKKCSITIDSFDDFVKKLYDHLGIEEDPL